MPKLWWLPRSRVTICSVGRQDGVAREHLGQELHVVRPAARDQAGELVGRKRQRRDGDASKSRGQEARTQEQLEPTGNSPHVTDLATGRPTPFTVSWFHPAGCYFHG